jgi:RHS repeat-associated protein
MVNGSSTYLHDANGNTTKDGLRDMNFTYNRLNLPRQVSKGGDELRYGYTADGRKREKKFNDVITRQYRGSIAYDGSGNPEYLLTPKGMAHKVGNNWVRQYNLTDHLGNVRAVLEQNGAIPQQTDYYPFGTAFSVANLNKNKYLYGGKEYQDEALGGTLFGLADFEARFMDSRIPRFTSMDPLREKYYWISPYAYAANNPIRFIDPTGMWFDEANEKKAFKQETALNKQIAKLEKQIVRLEKKGLSTDDLSARVTEMKSSITDIADMRANESTEFRYANANSKNNPSGRGNPTIDGVGTNTVTMYVENNTGSKSHEGRHGGDAARGTLTLENYNVNHEVSAYKAQYGYSGSIAYMEVNDLNKQIAFSGVQPSLSYVNSMNSITPSFVNSMGYVAPARLSNNMIQNILTPLYPPKIWTGRGWHYSVSPTQWNNTNR